MATTDSYTSPRPHLLDLHGIDRLLEPKTRHSQLPLPTPLTPSTPDSSHSQIPLRLPLPLTPQVGVGSWELGGAPLRWELAVWELKRYLGVGTLRWEWELVLGRQGSSQVRHSHSQLSLPLGHPFFSTPHSQRLPTPTKGETLGVRNWELGVGTTKRSGSLETWEWVETWEWSTWEWSWEWIESWEWLG